MSNDSTDKKFTNLFGYGGKMYSTEIFEYTEGNYTYYHLDRYGNKMSYQSIREAYSESKVALYGDYQNWKQGGNTLFLYGTGADTRNGYDGKNIPHDSIKRNVAESLDDFMYTILGHGNPGDTDYYPGIEGLKGNTSFFAISYGKEHNTEGVEVRDNDLLNKFAISNKTAANPSGEAFSVTNRSELVNALEKAIQIYPNQVSVTDELSQYVNLYGDDLKKADARVILNGLTDKRKTLVCDVAAYYANTGEAALNHYVKFYQNPNTGAQTLAYLNGSSWKWANGTALSQEEIGALKPVVVSIRYEKESTSSTTGKVIVKYDDDYKMVPEYAYALSFNVNLTDTAYREYMDPDKTYLPSETAPTGVTGADLDAITYYRKVEGGNAIYVSKAKYAGLSDTEKAKFEKENNQLKAYYYNKTIENPEEKQIGEDGTDYIAYPFAGGQNPSYTNGTSSVALGFQSNHEAWVTYRVNGSDPLTDYYDRPVVQVRPRGELIIGKISTENEVIDHDTEANTALFQLLNPTPKANGSHEILYISRPVTGTDNNRYIFVKDSNKNGTLEANETDTLIEAGTYRLREATAPQNHLAGEDTLITISYDAHGHMKVSFQESQTLKAAGMAGALMVRDETENNYVPVVLKDTDPDNPALYGETGEDKTDLYLQNQKLKTFEFGKVDQDDAPINHADTYTQASFVLIEKGSETTAPTAEDYDATDAAKAKVKYISKFSDTDNNRYTFVPAKVDGSGKLVEDTAATNQGILPGDYWLLETKAPANYAAGPAAEVKVSYADGKRVLTWPKGSPAAMGQAGAVVVTVPVYEGETEEATGTENKAIGTGEKIEVEDGTPAFRLQNKKNAVPLSIQKVNGDASNQAVSYQGETYEVTYVSAWGGIYIKNPDTGKYFYVGKDQDPNHSEYVKDPFTMINGQRVLTYPVPSDWKDQGVHNKPANITENYAVFFGADQSKTASFALVPYAEEYEVVGRGQNQPRLWIRVKAGQVYKGSVENYDRYYGIGFRADSNKDVSEKVALVNNNPGNLHTEPLVGICASLTEPVLEFPNATNQKPNGNLSIYGYYWNPNPTANSPHPADSMATVNTYLQQATPAQQRADGVFLSRPESALSANGVYRFVKAGAAAGSTDPADYNIPEGIYWLVETRSPDGFFAGGKPIRIKVEADPADESKAKLSFAGDSSRGSAEYNSFLHHVVKDGQGTVTGGPADLKYQNYELYNLPSSGGPGTYVFTTFGTMFLSLAAAHGWNLKKRKKKG